MGAATGVAALSELFEAFLDASDVVKLVPVGPAGGRGGRGGACWDEGLRGGIGGGGAIFDPPLDMGKRCSLGTFIPSRTTRISPTESEVVDLFSLFRTSFASTFVNFPPFSFSTSRTLSLADPRMLSALRLLYELTRNSIIEVNFTSNVKGSFHCG